MVDFSEHAEEAMRARSIERGWVIDTVTNPERLENDDRPGRQRAFRRVEAFGGRWLRVVFEGAGKSARVTTVFFDRKAGRSR